MLTKVDNKEAKTQTIGFGEFKTEIIPLNDSEHIRDCKHITDSEHIKKEWLSLAESAIEPNPFYTPDYLKALLKHICPDEDHWLVLIWSDANKTDLLGLFPVTKRGVKHGFPLPVTSFTFHNLIGICAPLIAPLAPEKTWVHFLKAVENHPDLPNIIYIEEFYRSGPTGTALKKLVNAAHIIREPVTSFERVAAKPGSDLDEYTKRWSRKKARNIRAREKKLKALGTVEYQLLDQNQAGFTQALDEVLALEQAGWKGKKGTALASTPETMAFAKEAFHSLCNGPLTHMSLLRLDGKIIAGQINLLAQDHIFFIKSAYDENLSHCSPGILLYKWALELMLDQRRYRELDSCANPNHPLREIWLEMNTVEEVFIAPATSTNQIRIRQLLLWRRFSHRVRKRLKNMLSHLPISG